MSLAVTGDARGRLLAGASLLTMLVAVLTETVLVGGPSMISVGALCAALLFTPRYLGRQQLVALGLCAAAALILLAEGETAALWRAARQSVGLGALFVALIWLRLAAARSEALARVSESVARQPSGRRHLGLALASHFIGVLLNVGIFGLMAPLVAGRARSDADPARSPEREAERRDMTIAVLRGFGFTMLWAPTAAAQAVITASIPAVTWAEIAPRALAMACSLIALSWLHSRLTRPALSTTATQPPARVSGEIAGLSLLILSMIALLLALHLWVGYGLTSSVAFASLTVATVWLALQAMASGENVPRRLSESAARYVRIDLSRAAPEIATLAAAGFLGAAIASIIPEAWMEAIVAPLSEHVLLLYLLVTALMPAISAAGLNPLVAASLIGGSFAAIPPGHIEPQALAFALASGWAVAYGVSPFTTGALVLAQSLGEKPETIAWRWNGRFTLLALAYAWAVVAIVAQTL